MRHEIGKFFVTLHIAGVVITARTFGQYIHSGWDGDSDYALYLWHGHKVRVPTIHHAQ